MRVTKPVSLATKQCHSKLPLLKGGSGYVVDGGYFSFRRDGAILQGLNCKLYIIFLGELLSWPGLVNDIVFAEQLQSGRDESDGGSFLAVSFIY